MIKPTESELEILQILWSKGHATVKEVNEEINVTKPTGYTTTLKIMQIMHEKGLLEKDSSSKQHVFKAKIAAEETQKGLLDTFISNAFQGNAMTMVMQALGNHQVSDDELVQLKKLIDQLENGQ